MKRQFTLVALFLCTLCTFAQFSGSGSGTNSDPYQITTAYQLSQMRNFLNQTDVYFKLMNDIDLTDFIAEEYLSQGWLPIGVASSPFKGTFNGNGKTITGLTINRTSSDYIGLFGYATNATIKNITIQNCEVNGQNYIGALIGYLEGCTIVDCVIMGNVKGKGYVGGIVGEERSKTTSFTNCNFTGDVEGSSNYVGGICGFASYIGNVSHCHFNGTINGSLKYVGGLFGYLINADAIISLCSVNGTINGGESTGGLFGQARKGTNLEITECYVSAEIISTGNNVGGLIGENSAKNVYNNYFVGSVSGKIYVGGLIGYNDNCIVFCNYTNATVEGKNNVGGICGRVSGSFKSNVAINLQDALLDATDTSIGRIYGTGPVGAVGTMGTSEENRALNTTAVYVNNKLQTDITDGPQHGTGTSMSSLKRKDTYVALGWDFDTVWGIDEGSSFPYLLNNPNTPTQTVTVSIPTTMTYGDAPITLPATTDQGQALTWTSSDNSVLSVDGNMLTPLKAGSATITAAETGNSGSNAFSQTFDVTVNKAPLVITAKSYTIAQGAALPIFEATYSGFKNGETESVLTTPPTFSCSATSDSAPGSYSIIPSGATATNYAITYVNGTLTIEEGSGNVDISIVIPSSGMTTYCSAYDLDFSSVTAFKAYVIVGYSKKTNTVVALQVEEAPAYTGLFLKGTAGTYQMTVAESESYHLDMLAGVINATTIQATEGRLTNLIPYTFAGTTIFIPASNGSNVDANRAYLQIETVRYNGQPVEILLIDKDSPLYGDINKDGQVNISDVTVLVNMILGQH